MRFSAVSSAFLVVVGSSLVFVVDAIGFDTLAVTPHSCNELKFLIENTWYSQDGLVQEHLTVLLPGDLQCDEQVTVSEGQRITISALDDSAEVPKVIVGKIEDARSFIVNHGHLELQGLEISNKGQNVDLRGIDNRNVLEVKNTKFDSFSTLRDGGAILSSGPRVVIESSLFLQNIASQSGGAVSAKTVEGAQVDIIDSVFHSNTAGGKGGCVNAEAGVKLLLESSRFEDSSSEGGQGGAVNMCGGRVSSCDLNNNTGGALVSSGSGLSNLLCDLVEVDSSSFVGNDGGAMRVENHRATIHRCMFEGNRREGDGAAILATGLSSNLPVDIVSSMFWENKPSRGAIFFSGGRAEEEEVWSGVAGAEDLVGVVEDSICGFWNGVCNIVVSGGMARVEMGCELCTLGGVEPNMHQLSMVRQLQRDSSYGDFSSSTDDSFTDYSYNYNEPESEYWDDYGQEQGNNEAEQDYSNLEEKSGESDRIQTQVIGALVAVVTLVGVMSFIMSRRRNMQNRGPFGNVPHQAMDDSDNL